VPRAGARSSGNFSPWGSTPTILRTFLSSRTGWPSTSGLAPKGGAANYNSYAQQRPEDIACFDLTDTS